MKKKKKKKKRKNETKNNGSQSWNSEAGSQLMISDDLRKNVLEDSRRLPVLLVG